MSKELRFEHLPHVTELFGKLLTGHGLSCTALPDGVVASSDGKLTFQFFLHMIRDQSDQKTIQLDFWTQFLNDKKDPVEIVESYAGFGATLRDAVDEAFRNMVNGSFHSIFSAVSGLPPCKCVENSIEDWMIGGRARRVFLGPFFTRGEFGQISDKTYNLFLTKVKDAVSSLAINEEVNWIRLFYSQSGGQVTTEAHWNNKRCPQLVPVLLDTPWPKLPEDQSGSIRFFFVIQKVELVAVPERLAEFQSFVAMKFLHFDDLSVESRLQSHDSYQTYLRSISDLMPQSAFLFATAPWHYNHQDPKCPHDSWLEEISLKELSSGKRKEIRAVKLELALLGAMHDRILTLKYDDVISYSIISKQCSQGHGDWLIDEVRLSEAQFVEHEIEFSNGFIKVECRNLELAFECSKNDSTG